MCCVNPPASLIAWRTPANRSGVVFDEEAGAEVAACLLVAVEDEDQVAGGRECLVPDSQQRGEEHRDAAFHVERAAAPDLPVDEISGERRLLPARAGGGDDIDVPVEQKRRRLPASREPHDKVRPLRVAGIEGRLEAGGLEDPGDVLEAGAFVSGRVGGVEAKQRLQQFDRSLPELTARRRKCSCALAAFGFTHAFLSARYDFDLHSVAGTIYLRSSCVADGR